LCPFDRRVVGIPLRLRQPVAALRRLRIDPQREAGILVAKVVSRVANVVAARAAEARVGAAQRVERDVPGGAMPAASSFLFAASTAGASTSRRRFDGLCFRPLDVWITKSDGL